MPGLGRNHLVTTPRFDQDSVDGDAADDAAEQRPDHERQQDDADAGQDDALVRRRYLEESIELLAPSLAGESFPLPKRVDEQRSKNSELPAAGGILRRENKFSKTIKKEGDSTHRTR